MELIAAKGSVKRQKTDEENDSLSTYVVVIGGLRAFDPRGRSAQVRKQHARHFRFVFTIVIYSAGWPSPEPGALHVTWASDSSLVLGLW